MAEKKKVVPLNSAIMIVIFVLQLIALFFMALGSPFDVYKLNVVLSGNNGCYSVWGLKQCGGNRPKTWHNDRYKTCGVFEATMKAAATFTIISLFANAMSALMSILAACKLLTNKIPVALFLLFGVVTTTVPWAALAGLYHNPTCRFGRMSADAKYAPGFAFFIISWGLTVISFILAIFA